MTGSKAFIGVSGWNYPSWRRDFYAGIPQRDWLSHCAKHFSAIEVNATFFRFIKAEHFRLWKEATPEDFVFCLKGHRFITHANRLQNVLPLILRMQDSAMILRDRIRCILWQLPRNLDKDLALLQSFARDLKHWPEARHVVEFRNPGWFDQETARMIRTLGLSICQSDGAEWPLWPEIATDLIYIRLYPPTADHRHAALEHWVEKAKIWLNQGYEVHIYLDNDPLGNTPEDAIYLNRMLNPPD